MKEFKDLEFERMEDSIKPFERAALQFDNGYGISVLTGGYSYSKGLHDLYEIGMLDNNGELMYTEITDNDVVGYITAEQVTEYMKKIQSAPKDIKNNNLWNVEDEEYPDDMPDHPLTEDEKEQMALFEESMKEVDAYEAKLLAERDAMEQDYLNSLESKPTVMIHSRTYVFDQPKLLDSGVEAIFNDKKKQVLSHTINTAVTDTKVLFILSFTYKDIHDIDVG